MDQPINAKGVSHLITLFEAAVLLTDALNLQGLNGTAILYVSDIM